MDDVEFYIYLALASLGVTGMVYVLLMLSDPEVWRRDAAVDDSQVAPVRLKEADAPFAARRPK